MNTNNVMWGYLIGSVQLLFGIVGLVTGWVSHDVALVLITTALTTFGIHQSNVAVGRAVGAIRGY